MSNDAEYTIQPDHNRETLLKSAGACLDYIRAVKFGEATALYTVIDGDFSLDIHVTVKCFRTAEKKKSNAE